MSEMVWMGVALVSVVGAIMYTVLSGGDGGAIVSETSEQDPRKGACNEVGHHYDEPYRASVYSRTTTIGRADVVVYLKHYKRCTKCDDLEVEQETIAKFKVDKKDGEVTRL